jgi:hypothetical protein
MTWTVPETTASAVTMRALARISSFFMPPH